MRKSTHSGGEHSFGTRNPPSADPGSPDRCGDSFRRDIGNSRCHSGSKESFDKDHEPASGRRAARDAELHHSDHVFSGKHGDIGTVCGCAVALIVVEGAARQCKALVLHESAREKEGNDLFHGGQ